MVRRGLWEQQTRVWTPLGPSFFPGWSHVSDLTIGTEVATTPDAWRYQVNAGTGRQGVSVLWPGEVMMMMMTAFWKAYFEIFLQSPHCVANCLQHPSSSGQGAVVCKLHSTHQALLKCKHVVCHVAQRDSSAFRLNRIEITFIFSIVLLAETINGWMRGWAGQRTGENPRRRASEICNLYLSAAARTTVWADPRGTLACRWDVQ